ncbi:prolyl oligopeptidase family serine peptidase [Nonlabens marinus]|uniref:prolyl oligopeptidase n=1 Tax=Nonlabens marinus S1-08 TaxID=1454201 RepID=W8VP25_9FLAO|nr:prolyl oligopeptidase family serine peptidase [Nonlabens marinus]BAO54794.1 prolyl endopeptidase [Nonlabens marinus S1-08]
MKTNPICLVALSILVLTSCKDEKAEDETVMALTYPETKKVDTTDTYFGNEVADPYRWLEDDRSEETGEWVKAQNKVTQDYLANIPYRNAIEDRLTELWNYEKIGAPFIEGDYTYYYKNDGLQNQSVLYRYENDADPSTATVFLDPNSFNEEGTISLGGMSFTEDGSKLAYAISEGGSDWRKLIILDAETKEQLGDTLVDLKFSGISWYKDEGIFYSSYDKPKGSELSAMTDQHKLYYHKLGTPQSSDKVVFGATADQKYRYVGGSVTNDQRFLVISASTSTNGGKIFMKRLDEANAPLVTVIDNFDTNSYVMHNEGDKLWIVTDKDAPNKKIVTTNFKNPTPANWTDLIPETESVLSPSTGGGYIFAEYMVDAVSQIKQYNYDGTLVRDVKLPGVGNVSGFGAKEDDKTLYYSFTNYVTPGSTYIYNIAEGTSELYRKPDVKFDPSLYESKQVFYTSKDGTKIPMIISYKKGMKQDGTNPTILYGYGGFNISLYPGFSVSRAAWMEMGGVYAVANLRGGGEYGTKWHDAGTKMQKQNVFDDFIAAAEYLKKEKYTSTEKLALQGGSNGGLLVGATMTQRPDLAAVAIPQVGVLDMLRYNKFTAGAGWAYDYGTAEDNIEMFNYLKGYSPLHNVKAGTNYPATLITTGDHDDRVVPAHSFKFAAELQSKQAGNNPTLIRIETDAGHGAGKPTSKIIEEQTDIYGFMLYNMGYKELPQTANDVKM